MRSSIDPFEHGSAEASVCRERLWLGCNSLGHIDAAAEASLVGAALDNGITRNGRSGDCCLLTAPP